MSWRRRQQGLGAYAVAMCCMFYVALGSTAPGSTSLVVTPPVRAATRLKQTSHQRPSVDLTITKRAAFYTNTTLLSFEFAHLYLALVAAVQRLGYTVDMLHTGKSAKLSPLQLADVADDHGLAVNHATLNYARVKLVNTRLYTRQKYDLFVSLGDDRAPPHIGIGDVNVHVCTFPYRPEDDMTNAHLFTLPSYDVVLTPSTYSHDNYLFHTELYLIPNVVDGTLIPEMSMLPPPYHSAAKPAPAMPSAKLNIVVPGHFAHNFNAVHESALALFEVLRPKLPPTTRLVLYGSTGHGGYLTKLKQSVQDVEGVDIVTDPTPDHQMNLLAGARVVWFLRQMEDETLEWRKPEPDVEWRLYEFMGVTLTSAMRMGTLPVVLDNDVHDAVVDQSNGFVAANINGVLKATVAAFDDDTWRRMAVTSSSSVAGRNFEAYTDSLTRIIKRAKAAQPLRATLQRVGSASKPVATSPSPSKAAVCIETRHHFALRASVINVASHLPTWSVTVFHGMTNARFVNNVLLDMPTVQTSRLPVKALTAAEYSDLIASPTFWMRITADTVFLFNSGTVLTGSVEPVLGRVLPVTAPERSAHTVGLIDVKQARSGRVGIASDCSLTADGVCYTQNTMSAVAITATAHVGDPARLTRMLNKAFGLDTTSAATDPLSWSLYTPSAGAPKTAALYTSYDIIYGGGESYLLQSAASLQSFGYSVDIIVHPENLAKTVDDVMRTATGLRVGLQRAGLRLLHVPHQGDTLAMPPQNYSVFYLLGNEKAPKLRGIGLVNFYMCQFPFDLNAPPVPPRIRTLATYDYVLVNSHFTYVHYAKYVSSLFEAMVDADMLVPQVELLSPPVQPFAGVQPPPSNRRNIAVLGRIFRARQNKGQHVAIAAFKALQGRIPADARLLLIGNVVPGHEPYLDQLRRKSAGLNVDIVTGQSQDRVLQLLQSSLVQWHMTGADALVHDPASYEHFGMSIVEGMSLGCVPVVLKRGGVVDIVQDSVNGYLAVDVDELVDKTAAVFARSASDLQSMIRAARTKAATFSPTEFTRKFKVLVDRGFLTRPFKHTIRHGSPVMRRYTPVAASRSTTNVAVLIEPRQHYALRFCTLNVATHLPRNQWGLHVFHGSTNGRFTRAVLADVDNVRYTRLPYGVLTIPLYNDLLKSVDFWTALHADNVLLFQTDSLLLGTDIGAYVGRYDYIGAPWHLENERWSVMKDTLGPEGVGNGGLSLRTTASALDIIKRHGAASNSSEQEDVFYVKYVRSDGWKLAPRQTAYGFCLEVPCVDVRPVDVPLAVHAAWYYNTEDRMAELLIRALPPPPGM